MGERPTAQGLAIGEQLKRLRVGRGLTVQQVGDAIGAHKSKVSRIEGGRVRLAPDDLRALLDLYEVNGRLRVYLEQLVEQQASRSFGFWREERGHASRNVPQYLALEGIADRFRSVQPLAIPGLAQSAAYAQLMLSMHWDGDDLQRELGERLRRQTRLRDGTLRAEFLIGEVALGVIPAEVRDTQLRHLIEVGQRDNVTLRIVPTHVLLQVTGGQAVVILGFADEGVDDVVYVEHDVACWLVDEPDAVRDAHGRYANVMAASLSEADSIRLITDLIGATV